MAVYKWMVSGRCQIVYFSYGLYILSFLYILNVLYVFYFGHFIALFGTIGHILSLKKRTFCIFCPFWKFLALFYTFNILIRTTSDGQTDRRTDFFWPALIKRHPFRDGPISMTNLNCNHYIITVHISRLKQAPKSVFHPFFGVTKVFVVLKDILGVFLSLSFSEKCNSCGSHKLLGND